MASLIDQITSLFRRGKPAATATTTTDEMAHSAQVTQVSERMRAETERVARVQICREMYETDPRAEGVLSSLARDAVKGGCTVVVKNNPDAEAEAAALFKRLKLASRLDDWARLTFRDGDSMLELGVDNARNIALVTRKPTLQMHRNSNYADLFDDPQRAFWMSMTPGMFYASAPQDALWFAEWQIIHARWKHDEGSRYGRPLFGSANGAYKRMKEGELDIAVRRKTRSGLKYLHVIEDGDASAVEAYKEMNKAALDDPFAAVADFFTNRKGSISTVAGDARLQEIGDVMHHIRTWWTAAIVPMSLLGYGQDLNRDVLEEQKEQYDRALETITQWVEDDLVVPLVERQWLLKGLYPDNLEYEIKWKSKHTLRAKDLAFLAEAMLKLRALGLSDEVIFALLEHFLPGIDLSLLQNAVKPAQAEAGMPERLAREAAALHAFLNG